MKKLFALILAVLMICAMSVSVFAADHIVGSHGGSGKVGDGVDPNFFSANNPTYEVNITATVGDVQHRYAVDIEYENMTFDIAASNLVWDVNSLTYVVDDTSEDAETIGEDKAYKVTVYNYSDLPVNLSVEVEDKFTASTGNEDYANVAAHTDEEGTVKFSETEISSAIGANNTSAGQVQSVDFYVTVRVEEDGKDWNDVANYYANYFTAIGGSEVTIATATITVAKVSGT